MANGQPGVEGPLLRMTAHQMVLDGNLIQSAAGQQVDLRNGVDEVMLRGVESLLRRKRQLWPHLNPAKPFPGVLVIEAEGDLSFDVIAAVMSHAALAGYREVSFVGVKVHH